MDNFNVELEKPDTPTSVVPGQDHIRHLFEKHFLSSTSEDNQAADDEHDGAPSVNGKSLQEFLALLASVNRNTSEESSPMHEQPLEMSFQEQAFFMSLYGAAIVLAVSGNLAVILVFLFGRRWKSDLSIFLVNLAFSDIVLSVFCMPFTMSQVVKHHWQFSDLLCPIVLFLQLSSVIASVFTLIAIGVDRYLFVTRPLKARLTKRKGKVVIGIIWILALTFSSIQLSVVRCSKFVHNQVEYKDCQEDWPNPTVRQIYTVALALLTYLIPLAVLVYVYICVGRILWQRTPPGETVSYSSAAASGNHRSYNGVTQLSIGPYSKHPLLTVVNLSNAQRLHEERHIKSKQRVVKMLVVIVLVFAICWFPLHLFFLAIDFLPESIRQWREELDEQSFTYTFLAFHFLAMSSSYVNPLIYSFMNQNFRSDVRQLWHRASSGMARCIIRSSCRCKITEDEDVSEDEPEYQQRLRPLVSQRRSHSTTSHTPHQHHNIQCGAAATFLAKSHFVMSGNVDQDSRFILKDDKGHMHMRKQMAAPCSNSTSECPRCLAAVSALAGQHIVGVGGSRRSRSRSSGNFSKTTTSREDTYG